MSELDLLEETLLAVVTNADGPVVATDTASREVVDRLRDKGLQWNLSTSAPWYGLADACRHLEELGMIEVDPGVAEFHHPDSPAPITKVLYLCLPESKDHVG